MRCFVYKSLRKADTYVYLGQREDFARLPESLRGSLGELSLVMDFDLDAGRKLARGDAGVVLENLAACGFHIQMPPPALPESWAHGER